MLKIPTKPDSNAVTEAFQLAQALAEKEISSIERLHQRTLKYLSFLAGAFSILVALLGFVGYQNLKHFALLTAETEMRTEVTRQVDGLLTKKDIDSIVIQTVNEKASKEIAAIVARETERQVERGMKERESEIQQIVARRTSQTVDSMRPFIEDVATTKTRQLLDEREAPRHLSLVQRSALAKALAQYRGVGFQIRPYSDSPEQRHYADELIGVSEVLSGQLCEEICRGI